MSDQEPKQVSAETGSVSAEISHSAAMPSDPVTVSATEASPARDANAHEAVVSEPVAPEPSMSEPALSETMKAEPAKAEASASVSEPETASEKISAIPTKVMVMPRGDRAWTDHDIHVGAEEVSAHQSMFGKRRIAAIAAMVALAIASGALGGAFATAAFMHGGSEVAKASVTTASVPTASAPAAGGSPSLEASLSRIDSEVQALKSGLDHTSKLGMSQFNKTSDRLDKIERAQAEPAAKLARLSDTVDKLRAAPAVPAASAAKETTGSIGQAQQQASAAPASKPDAKSEVGRLPTLDDWILRDVAYGGALIEGRRGSYDVYAGDTIPGLGRVDAIRRQDGRWVVVTSRGLIVAR